MKRREVIGTGAAGIPIALSGCLRLLSSDEERTTANGDKSTTGTDGSSDGGDPNDGGSSDGDDDPTSDGGDGNDERTEDDGSSGDAEFETSVSLDGTPATDSEFYADVEVTNTGDGLGTFEDRLVATGRGQEQTATVETDELGAGETTSVEAGPFQFDAPGDYRFELESAGAETDFAVSPEQIPPGETVQYDDDFELTVNDVSLQESVLDLKKTTDREPWGVEARAAPSDERFVVVEITVENRSSTARDLEGLSLAYGEWYENDEENPQWLFDTDGKRLAYGTMQDVSPSEPQRGYFVGHVPRSALGDGPVLVGRPGGDQSAVPKFAWTASRATDGAVPVPDVSVADVSVPSTADVGLDHDIEFTLSNDGDAEGMFRSVLEWEESRDDWQQVRRAESTVDVDVDFSTGGVIEVPVPAGETKTVTLSNYSIFTQAFNYRLAATDTSWLTEFQTASLSLGETIKPNERTRITVTDVRIESRLKMYDGDDGRGTYTLEADSGKQFVAYRVVYERASRQVPSKSPKLGYTGLTVDGIEDVYDYVSYEEVDSIGEDWYQPIDGSLEKTTTLSGWNVRETDSKFNESELKVFYKSGNTDYGDLDPLRAEWD